MLLWWRRDTALCAFASHATSSRVSTAAAASLLLALPRKPRSCQASRKCQAVGFITNFSGMLADVRRAGRCVDISEASTTYCLLVHDEPAMRCSLLSFQRWPGLATNATRSSVSCGLATTDRMPLHAGPTVSSMIRARGDQLQLVATTPFCLRAAHTALGFSDDAV